jgi:hypothetical protein
MRRFNKRRSLGAALLGAVLILVGIAPARGDFEVQLSYGGATILIDGTTGQVTTSGGASTKGAIVDTSTTGTIGILNLTVSNNGTTGGFKISATIADSNSPGTPAAAIIDLSSLTITNQTGVTGNSTLTVTSGDTGFTAPTGQVSLLSTASATASGNNKSNASFTFTSYMDTTNAQFGRQRGTSTITLNPIAPGSSGSGNVYLTTVVNPQTPQPPYSLTEIETITLANGDKLTDGSTGTSLLAPAPLGWVLLLSALPCLGVGLWRRSRRPA